MPKSWREKTKPHLFCAGCGHGITLKQLGFAIDELNIQDKSTLGIDIGCSLLVWNFFDIDTVQTHHGRTTPVMAGYKNAKKDRYVIAYTGDGGGYAIGLQSLIHAAFRNDPVTVILVNNGNYAMTGGQVAPTTMTGIVTSTTPKGKPETLGGGFRGPELLSTLCSKKAYIARSTVSKPLILRATIKKALQNQSENNSFSFVEVLSICPINWKMNAKESFERLSEMEEYFPVKEFFREKNVGRNEKN